ncbi:hypothetical protein CHISP_2268 [Chitinispirillum alkaliphilum]|nr:hypothetical protein CHISP_2268 [Chitinispirillum alkaliphilum]
MDETSELDKDFIDSQQEKSPAEDNISNENNTTDELMGLNQHVSEKENTHDTESISDEDYNQDQNQNNSENTDPSMNDTVFLNRDSLNLNDKNIEPEKDTDPKTENDFMTGDDVSEGIDQILGSDDSTTEKQNSGPLSGEANIKNPGDDELSDFNIINNSNDTDHDKEKHSEIEDVDLIENHIRKAIDNQNSYPKDDKLDIIDIFDNKKEKQHSAADLNEMLNQDYSSDTDKDDIFSSENVDVNSSVSNFDTTDKIAESDNRDDDFTSDDLLGIAADPDSPNNESEISGELFDSEEASELSGDTTKDETDRADSDSEKIGQVFEEEPQSISPPSSSFSNVQASKIDPRDQPFTIPDHVLTPTLADIYFQQGQSELAWLIYNRLIDKDPDNEKLRSRAAQIKVVMEQEKLSEQNEAKQEKETSKPKTRKTVKKKSAPRTKKTTKDERPLAGVRLKKKKATKKKSNSTSSKDKK